MTKYIFCTRKYFFDIQKILTIEISIGWICPNIEFVKFIFGRIAPEKLERTLAETTIIEEIHLAVYIRDLKPF